MRIHAWAIAATLSCHVVTTLAAKPVLLLGTNYERAAFVSQVLTPGEIAYESSPDWVDPAKWADYAAVVVGDSASQPLNNETSTEVRKYLEQGGALILTGNALPGLAGISSGRLPDWFPGFGQSKVAMARDLGECVVTKPKTGSLSAFMGAKWTSQALALQPAVGSFQIGNGTQCIASLEYLGKGFIAFAGSPLFRVQNASKLAEAAPRLQQLKASLSRTTDETQRRQLANKVADMEHRLGTLPKESPNASALAKLLLAFVQEASPSLAHIASSTWRQQHAQDNLVFWQRDPVISPELYAFSQRAETAAWVPPEPSEKELLSELKVDCGQDDATAVLFNLTAVHDLHQISLSWISAEKNSPTLEISQAGPLSDSSPDADSGMASEAFWLRPAHGDIQGGRTSQICAKISTAGISPGSYSGSVQVKWADGAKSLPVKITVHSARFREASALQLGFYGFSWLSPFPRQFPELNQSASVSLNAQGAEPILANQRSLGAGAIVDTTLSIKAIRVAGDTASLVDHLGNTRGDFSLFEADGQVRPLDFSLYDEQIQIARALGFSRVNIRHGLAVFSQADADYIRQLTGAPYLSDKWKRAFIGIWSQFRAYLAKAGFQQFTFKFGDELSIDSLQTNWQPIAHLAAEAGWWPETNPTGQAVNLETLGKITDVCRSYSININFLDEFLKWKAEGKLKLLPGSKIACYGSWGYHKSPSVVLRRACWEAWAKGLAGLDVYTYAKLYLFDGREAYNPVSSMGLLTGWRETSYLQQLADAYQKAMETGDHSDWSQQAGAFLNIVRQGDQSFPWKNRPNPPFPFEIRELNADTATLDRMRAQLFSLLDQKPDRL